MSLKDFRFFLLLFVFLQFFSLPANLFSAGEGKKAAGGAGLSCPAGMVYIPAGEFRMGCNQTQDPKCEKDEKPYHQVYLDAYCLDRWEVTAGDYGACFQAGKCLPTPKGKECNLGRKDRRRHPINCVNWDRAEAYCRWKGKRLPTEAEWEKAARGTDERIYPWGNQPPTCADAVFPERKEEPGCGSQGTWKVGSKPKGASPYGVMDMAGNVLEWIADWYDRLYYFKSPRQDPPGPMVGSLRILRGGDWWHGNPHTLQVFDRNPIFGALWSKNWGFRCAGDPR
jgi:formylglycine-generating enzyme required for sulfatase activity